MKVVKKREPVEDFDNFFGRCNQLAAIDKASRIYLHYPIQSLSLLKGAVVSIEITLLIGIEKNARIHNETSKDC